MSKTKEEIQKAFNELGKNPGQMNLTFQKFDLVEGEQITVMFLGMEEDVVMGDFEPADMLKFADLNGIIYYERGSVLMKKFHEGALADEKFYQITFMGERSGGKGDYKMYNLALLTPDNSNPEESDLSAS